MGGVPPIVYNVFERRLVVNPIQATVRQIFERYLELGSVRRLKEHLEQRGVVSKLGVAKNGVRWVAVPFSRRPLQTARQSALQGRDSSSERMSSRTAPGDHGAGSMGKGAAATVQSRRSPGSSSLKLADRCA